jgi:hypothetical protein
MDEARTMLGAALRQPLHRAYVHRQRRFLLTLADLHVVEGRAVEYEVRPQAVERGRDGRVIGDVENGARGRRDVRSGAQQLLEVGGELTTPAGDQDPFGVHRTAPCCSICPRTSLRSSSQRML